MIQETRNNTRSTGYYTYDTIINLIACVDKSESCQHIRTYSTRIQDELDQLRIQLLAKTV